MVTAKAMVYFYGKDDVIFPLQGVQNPTSQQIRSLCPSGIKDPQKRKSHQASNMACLLILSCLAFVGAAYGIRTLRLSLVLSLSGTACNALTHLKLTYAIGVECSRDGQSL